MGRPSKLTEKQWEQIGKRMLGGEAARALASEFGVTEGALRKRFSTQNKQIRTLANQGLAFEQAFKSAPVSTQVSTLDLMGRLRSISDHLAGAAEFGAATAHRLAGIAHAKVQEIDDAKPLDAESMDALKSIGGLTRIANEASEIGVNLIKANKDAVDSANQAANKRPPSGLAHFYGDTE